MRESAAAWHLTAPAAAAAQRDVETAARRGRASGTCCQRIFLSSSACSKPELLPASPTGLFSSARTSCWSGFSPISFAPGEELPHLTVQMLLKGADVPQVAMK